MFKVAVSLLIALSVPITVLPIFIKIQKKHKIGQRIRQEGPDLHQHKAGTPTMGGLVVLFSVLVSLLFFRPEDKTVYVVFLLLCGFGFVGFLDDFIKYYKGRSLGLKARSKIVMQLVICFLFLIWYSQNESITQNVILPFSHDLLYLPFVVFIPFVILVFISTTNAVNLTDGLDGLATGLMVIALIAYTVIAFS